MRVRKACGGRAAKCPPPLPLTPPLNFKPPLAGPLGLAALPPAAAEAEKLNIRADVTLALRGFRCMRALRRVWGSGWLGVIAVTADVGPPSPHRARGAGRLHVHTGFPRCVHLAGQVAAWRARPSLPPPLVGEVPSLCCVYGRTPTTHPPPPAPPRSSSVSRGTCSHLCTDWRQSSFPWKGA